MKNRIDITTKNNFEHKTLLAILYANGWSYSEEPTYESAHNNKKRYKSVVVYADKSLGGNFEYYSGGSTEKEYVFSRDLSEIIDILSGGRSIIINNVGNYHAIVTSKDVEVGCQTISHAKVEEIYEAIQSFKH